MNLFGYELKKAQKKRDEADPKIQSFAPPAETIDGGYSIDAGGHYGQVFDLGNSTYKNEIDLILKYREIAMLPEIDAAIEDIVSESIVSDEDSAPVELITEDLDLPDSVKKKIVEEFENVVELLNFNWYGHDTFRRWYIDGRLYFHKIVDKNNPKNGLLEIRPIDPTKLRRVKENVKEKDPTTGIDVVVRTEEYFIYSPSGHTSGPNSFSAGPQATGLKIAKEAILFVSSGILDPTRSMVIGPLHKSLKVANQLGMLEDALVVYRLARAPERRIFYIDVGNLPKGKAEEYVNGIMTRYRNKMTYDASTGEMRDDKRHMSMLEDFWLPRREGGRGTEITTLPGGENLGQIEDILYFMKKLYKSMGVPSSRLSSEDSPMVSIGRSGEITREELKYQKYISRMRKKFSSLFIEILRDQVLLKGILTEDEWDEIKQDINVDYAKDNYFAELTEAEILRDRLATLREIEEYVGKYFSMNWIRKNVLHQSDEDIDLIDKDIAKEPSNDDIEYEESYKYKRSEDEIRANVMREETQKRLLENLNDFITSDDSDEIINNIKSMTENLNNG